MAPKKKAADPLPETVTVYPSPALAERGEHLAGVGVGGAEVTKQLAREWLDAGLVTLTPPDSAEE